MQLEIHQSITISVSARRWYNPTGISVFAGEKYTFQASGTWTDWFKKTDADGYSHWYMNLYNRFKRSSNNQWFALMGSIAQQKSFLIGKQNTILCSSSGMLYLFANDIKGFYWNNFGSLTITITRES